MVFERVFAAGAVDATLTPVMMKKSRPGHVLSVLVPREKSGAVLAVLFAETTALGVRVVEMQRRVLPRRFAAVQVNGQDIRIKVATFGQVTARPRRNMTTAGGWPSRSATGEGHLGSGPVGLRPTQDKRRKGFSKP